MRPHRNLHGIAERNLTSRQDPGMSPSLASAFEPVGERHIIATISIGRRTAERMREGT